MTAGEIVSIGFLALMVVLILWNLRGHRRSGKTGEPDDMDSGGSAGVDGGGD